MIELAYYPDEIVALQRLAEAYRLTFRMPNESVAYLTGNDFVVSVSVDMDGVATWYYDVIHGSEVKSYALGFLLFQKRNPVRVPDVQYPDNRDNVRYSLQGVISVITNYGTDVLRGEREWFSEYTWGVSDVIGDLRTRILTAISLRKMQAEHARTVAASKDRTAAIVPAREHILHAIDAVLDECNKSQLTAADVTVGLEILGLQKVRMMVEQQWPLSDVMKAQINIGPVAARNLADWNDSLATALMVLHHVLKHDGDSLHKLSGSALA